MEETNDTLKKIVKGTGIFLIGLFISKILGYAYRLVTARIGAEQYGLLSIALAVLGMLTTTSLLGMSEGIIRFVSFYKGKSDRQRVKGVITFALKISLPISLLSGLLLFFFSDWISFVFFHDTQLSILFKIFAFIIPLDVLRNIFINAMIAFQKVEYEVYSKSIAENLIKVVLTLIAVYLGLSVIGAAIAYLISVFVSFVLSFYFLEKKVFPIVQTKIISITSNREVLWYSLPLLLTGFTFMIIQWSDTLMISYFKTSYEVGLYNVAAPTAALLYLFPLAIRTLFFPILSELYAQGKMDSFKKIYQTTVKWNLMVSSVIFIFLVVFSQQILRILFGEAYIKDKIFFIGHNFPVTALAMIILSSGFVLGEVLRSSKDVLLVLKRTKLIFFNTIIGTGFNIVFNYVLIPDYGIIGAAVATAFAYFLITAMVNIEAYAITKINPLKSESIKILVLGSYLMLLMILFKVYLIASLTYMVIVFLIFVSIYFILLFITKSFDEEDITILTSIKKKFIKI